MVTKGYCQFSRRLSKQAITTIVVVGALVGCAKSELTNTREQRAPARVMVESLHVSREKTVVEAVGTSRAFRSVLLHPVTAGEVVRVNFVAGQKVIADDVLVELDQRKEQLALELAEFRLTEARNLYNRYLRSAETGATLPTILEAAKTALEAARIEVSQATIALQDRNVKAPFTGFAGLTDIDAGDRVQPDSIITSLDDRESLLVSFDLPELLIGRVAQGDAVKLLTWSVNAEPYTGTLIDLDSRINPESRTFVARALIQNQDDRLRPGMSFRVTLDIVGDPYPTMPEIAVQWGADGAYIWTVEEGKAQRNAVNIVQRKQGQVLVEADLSPDAIIITEGIHRLRPGLPVSPEARVADVDDEPQTAVKPG